MYERILDLIQAEDVDTLFGIPDPSFFGMFIEAERRGMREPIRATRRPPLRSRYVRLQPSGIA